MSDKTIPSETPFKTCDGCATPQICNLSAVCRTTPSARRHTHGGRPMTLQECADAEAPSAAYALVPVELWGDIVDFVNDHVDVRDGEDGVPQANTAMYLSTRIEQEVK